MKYDDLLKEICKKETTRGLYDIKIEGISIYNLIRRIVRNGILNQYGMGENIKNPPVGNLERLLNALKSVFQISRLLFIRKRTDIVFHSFERLEMVNGLFMDKFTDPLVDYLEKGDYLIIEPSRGGRHLSPRLHKNKIVYTDAINLLARITWQLKKNKLLKKNTYVINQLLDQVDIIFPNFEYNKVSLTNYIIRILLQISYYQKFFKKIQAKTLIAPARGSFMHIIPAARRNGMTILELQHGITYSETLTYSGFIDHNFSPDFFLSFGKLSSARYYGVKENQVVEIGYAFENYIKRNICKELSDKKVLVVSSPEISDIMVKVTCTFASQFPDIKFDFRAHPNEILDKERQGLLEAFKNISIDDNNESISVTLNKYYHVLGENSTVLYEALAMGKKVGKLNMEGLTPRYLEEDDACFFYEIKGKESFSYFISSNDNTKPSRKIYSDFKPELLLEIMRN